MPTSRLVVSRVSKRSQPGPGVHGMTCSSAGDSQRYGSFFALAIVEHGQKAYGSIKQWSINLLTWNQYTSDAPKRIDGLLC